MPVDGGRADQPSADVPGRPQPAPTADNAEITTRDKFERVLTTLCTNARGDVHLDLAELRCVDAAAVAALVRAAGSLNAPAQLVLHNSPDTVVRILQLTVPDHIERGIQLH